MIQLFRCSSKYIVYLGLMAVLTLFTQEVLAQSKSSKAASRRTTVNFEDQLVEGQAQKPELFYLLQQRNNNFKRLIRLRENFLPEMRKASEEVGPGGGGSASRGSAH